LGLLVQDVDVGRGVVWMDKKDWPGQIGPALAELPQAIPPHGFAGVKLEIQDRATFGFRAYPVVPVRNRQGDLQGKEGLPGFGFPHQEDRPRLGDHVVNDPGEVGPGEIRETLQGDSAHTHIRVGEGKWKVCINAE